MASSLLQRRRGLGRPAGRSWAFARLAPGVLAAAGLCAQAADREVVARVEEAVRSTSGLAADLRTVCVGIGARMAGTPGMRDALDWGRQAFADAGLANVRSEPVPMPLRWEEGETRVEIQAPHSFRIRAAATALSPAVPTALVAPLVDGGSGQPGVIARSPERVRDAVALVELDEAGSFDDLAVAQRAAMVSLREAAEAGAKAVLYVSTRPGQLLYRHVNSIGGRLDPIPSALVSRDEGLRLLQLVRTGEAVRVSLRMPNRIGGPYETANVVAELPGGDRADEIVLLGAHLDSWDMGSGCMDNGANVAVVAHVARVLAASGARLRRTVRFVLFGGEEFGLFGSLAYVDRHRAELGDHVAAIVHDMGAGPLAGYSVGARPELLPRLESALEASRTAEGLRHTTEAYFLSDNFTFALRGVPALFAVQDTEGFFPVYHSEADSLERVRIEDVTDIAAVAAAAVAGIADHPERFGRRLPEDEILAWLRRLRMVSHLRFLGVWDAWRPGADGAE